MICETDYSPGSQHLCHGVIACLPRLLVDYPEYGLEGLVHGLFTGPSRQLFSYGVDERYASRLVGGDDAVADGTKGDGEALLFGVEGFVGALALGDVPYKKEDVLLTSELHVICRNLHGKDPAVFCAELRLEG